jgi:hypothetical protein
MARSWTCQGANDGSNSPTCTASVADRVLGRPAEYNARGRDDRHARQGRKDLDLRKLARNAEYAGNACNGAVLTSAP